MRNEATRNQSSHPMSRGKKVLWTVAAIGVFAGVPAAYLFGMALFVDPAKVPAGLSLMLVFGGVMCVFLGLLGFGLIGRWIIRRCGTEAG